MQKKHVNLKDEMEKIIRVTKPDMKIFIGESIAGNDVVLQSQEFDRVVKLDGVILTKADVDEKGGAMLSVAYVTKKPILYLGVGQKQDDLERFDKRKIIEKMAL
jgi:fused signal recognition particle receptor